MKRSDRKVGLAGDLSGEWLEALKAAEAAKAEKAKQPKASAK
jgi:hypothetical protein